MDVNRIDAANRNEVVSQLDFERDLSVISFP